MFARPRIHTGSSCRTRTPLPRCARSLLASAALLFTLAPFTTAQQGPGSVQPDPAPPDTVAFAFERPALSVPRYTLTLTTQGAGRYQGEESIQPVHATNPPASIQPFDSKILFVSPPTIAKVFATAHELHLFNTVCASKAKNIADTGKKTITFNGRDGTGSCTYNYTENKKLQEVTNIFLGIAATLDEGRRLDYMHRYDRLGLDAELESFTREVKEGRALEVATIWDSLHSLANDPEVLERVRTRAAALTLTAPDPHHDLSTR